MPNPVYSPPPASTVLAALAAGPVGTPSDHNNVRAVYTTTNASPTQGGLPVTVPLGLPADVVNSVESVMADPAVEDSDDATLNPFAVATPRQVVRLQVQDISMPIVANSALRIFLNRPDANPNVPDADAHHVANVAYFCCGGRAGIHPCFVFDLSRAMKRLRNRGLVKKGTAWTVQVLTVPLIPGTSAPTVVPGTFTLTVTSL